MARGGVNRLIADLRSFCAQHRLDEKCLLAPSRRVGQQWLDWVVRSGQPVLNVHVESPESLALLRLAAPELERRGLRFLSGIGLEVLVSRIFSSLRNPNGGYLCSLEPTRGLIRTIASTLTDLRLAGITASEIRPNQFERGAETKGEEIAALLAEYERRLSAERLVDYAGVLRIAAEGLRANPTAVPEGAFVLLPADMEREFGALEREFWNAIPEARRVVLEVDRPGEAPADEMTDASLLRWINSPAAAPDPRRDDTAFIFRADGEVNEVRQVLQRCVANGIPLDQVEVIHTDAATYVPLIYEVASRIAPDDGTSVPVTFAEGIPARYSRPARALLGWLEWIRGDYPQSALRRLIQDGLLKVEGAEEAGFSFWRLGALVRTLPIGRGRDRYLPAVDRELKSLALRASAVSWYEEGYEERADLTHKYSERTAGLKLVRALLEDLFAHFPDGDLSQKSQLESAAYLLEHHARGASEFDEYSRVRLLSQIGELAEWLEAGDVEGLRVWEWLTDLVRGLHVNAQGPRPGCLFVAPVQRGGHSGRPHTFILGLDDSRFPGAGSQDPLLLDEERAQVSRNLPTAGSRLDRKIEGLAELLARVRGAVTLGYSCRGLDDDRAKFPSSAIWSAYRIISGEREGDQEAFARWLPQPTVSFAPDAREHCIDMADWWLWRLCGDEAVADPDAAIAASFPHLGRGMIACSSRASDLFTEYDGYVPEAGADADPTRPDGPVLSAGRLEMLAGCPLAYFLRYVLNIEPPEGYEADPATWLDPAERGQMLHTVFHEFMSRLQRRNLLPDGARDAGLLQQVMDEQIAALQQEKPPPNQDVFERERRELTRIARIFLHEEALHCLTHRPLCFEAGIGLRPSSCPSFLDSAEPACIELPGGGVIRAQGRIDRVDEIGHDRGKRLVVWDYKTGSARSYDRTDPFRQGRCIQAALYLALVEARLREADPDASVEACGYFFPNLREHGERIAWNAEQLGEGKHVIATLCRMIAGGCFPFTNDAADVTFSGYLAAFGDPAEAAEAVTRKMGNPANDALAPFRKLREQDGE